MPHRRSIDAQAMGLMLTLSIIWGFQQVTLKAVSADITPLMAIAVRCGLSAILVFLFMLVRREPLALPSETLPAGLAVGILFAGEFLLLAEGLRHTSAAHSVVFLYTAPIFAAIGLHRKLPAERMGHLQWIGVSLAFAGIVCAFLGNSPLSSLPISKETIWGDLLALAGGCGWGATTVVVRTSRLNNAPATVTLLYQLTGGFVLLLCAAFALGQAGFHPTFWVYATLAFHAIVVSFASYLVWFWMLKRYLASQLGVFSFMTPLFGVAFGVLLLGEPLEPAFVLGAVLVLAGILLVNLGKRR